MFFDVFLEQGCLESWHLFFAMGDNGWVLHGPIFFWALIREFESERFP